MIAKQQTVAGDYLPARMLNEFTYCPRLFYYEHVEGLFEHNRETVEGALGHSRVDERQDDLPPPEQLAEAGQKVRARSVTLASDAYGVIEVVRVRTGRLTPPRSPIGLRPQAAFESQVVACARDAHMFVVPPSGGRNRLKPALRTLGCGRCPR